MIEFNSIVNHLRKAALFSGSFLACFLMPFFSFSQDSLLVNSNASEKQPIEIDILSSYYKQDGNHSAVTGGEGTEALKDYANIIKIKVPLKKDKTLNIKGGVSYFTSASSDNINPNTISSASKDDIKVSVNAIIDKEVETKKINYYFKLGASHEAHFASLNAGLGFSKNISKWQSKVSFGNQFFMDAWGQWYKLSKLYPNDYYGKDDLVTNNRYALQSFLRYEQIFNQRLKGSISAEFIQQFGLLSIPFHRVYFSDIAFLDLERLPDYKLRIPITGRLNYAASDWLIIRSYYRFYWDNFNMKAHSTSLELPIKVHRFLTIYPQYRFHYQYGNQYFKPKGEHISTDEFYTSDNDLADLTSHYVSLGLEWVPFRKNKNNSNRFIFKSVKLNGGYYRRSDDFSSWLISGGLSWNIMRKEEHKFRNS